MNESAKLGESLHRICCEQIEKGIKNFLATPGHERELLLANKVECLTAELAEYKRVADVAVCTFCGHESAKTVEAMAEHILACPKRPELPLTEEILRLTALLEHAKDRLKYLANEAQGFMSIADPKDVGYTNIECLKMRIDNAREFLSEVEPGYVCENCGEETYSMRKYCNDECLRLAKEREAKA